ncbi:hypothetical protein [Nocardia farcinica]|uniref:hypothetical protein n=1 Tax=Nocardia farcinica TaxID=37329 RepID=UPI0024581AEE|nr:hypothetical protein [Nocardia farcinica]
MPERTPRLTAEELEALREATLQHYEAAGYPDELTDRLRAYTDEPDGGLINLIDMAIELARSHEAALERIAELEAERARLVEGVASTVRRFSATLDERDALRARVAELEAERDRARDAGKTIGQALATYNRIALDATGLRHVIGENGDGDWQVVWERLADLGAEVRKFIDQRPEYVNSCRNANSDADHDYYRWQGGAEARRQLAQRLGWTVPHEFGDKTTPKGADHA